MLASLTVYGCSTENELVPQASHWRFWWCSFGKSHSHCKYIQVFKLIFIEHRYIIYRESCLNAFDPETAFVPGMVTQLGRRSTSDVAYLHHLPVEILAVIFVHCVPALVPSGPYKPVQKRTRDRFGHISHKCVDCGARY